MLFSLAEIVVAEEVREVHSYNHYTIALRIVSMFYPSRLVLSILSFDPSRAFAQHSLNPNSLARFSTCSTYNL